MGALHKSDSHVQRIKVVPSLSDSWQPKDSHVESTLKSLKKKMLSNRFKNAVLPNWGIYFIWFNFLGMKIEKWHYFQ